MKSGRRRTPLALLLLASILACEAASLNGVSQNKARKVPATEELTDAAIGSRAAPVGTERAPVDGKDGMPHDGPWVQTEADRKKQKLKDVDDDEKVIINTRTSSTSSTDIPQSNDGVMDDRNRKSPQEGTRGTEGGVSEKSKDGQLVEKKPEQPKEALPLPHSEKEKMKIVGDNDETVILDDGTKKPYAVCLPPYCLDHTNILLGTNRPSRQIPRHSLPRKPVLTQRLDHHAWNSQSLTFRPNRLHPRTRRHLTSPLPRTILHHDHVLRNRRQNLPRRRPDGNAP